MYREIAHLAIDTEAKSPEQVAERNPRPLGIVRQRGKHPMHLILALPMEARLAAIFVLGACLGSLVNLAAARLAWHPRRISP